VTDVWVYGKTKTTDSEVLAEVSVLYQFGDDAPFRIVARGSAPVWDDDEGQEIAQSVALATAMESVAKRLMAHAHSLSSQIENERQGKLF